MTSTADCTSRDACAALVVEVYPLPIADFNARPAVRTESDARARIRAARTVRRSVLAVLDDDPTGSQTVHDVEVVTELDPTEVAGALDVGDTCFLLTNTRGMPETDAVFVNRAVATELLRAGRERGLHLELVSRSDSTLRGHVTAEIDALAEVTGGVDGVLFVPAYLEAGRFTAGDTHLARVNGTLIPVGETEFAKDATFGYNSSDLRQFLAERSGGSVRAADVYTIGLDDIRSGGPDRVRDLLSRVRDGRWVVVNAVDYADLDVVALGVQTALESGPRFLHRCGPSWLGSGPGRDRSCAAAHRRSHRCRSPAGSRACRRWVACGADERAGCEGTQDDRPHGRGARRAPPGHDARP
jgi:hypothetical protein